MIKIKKSFLKISILLQLSIVTFIFATPCVANSSDMLSQQKFYNKTDDSGRAIYDDLEIAKINRQRREQIRKMRAKLKLSTNQNLNESYEASLHSNDEIPETEAGSTQVDQVPLLNTPNVSGATDM